MRAAKAAKFRHMAGNLLEPSSPKHDGKEVWNAQQSRQNPCRDLIGKQDVPAEPIAMPTSSVLAGAKRAR